MRKFLVFFVLLFGVMCGAMAGTWPENTQNDNVTDANGCGHIYKNDGSEELVILFETNVVTPHCDLSNWISELNSAVNDIGSIVIYGSADRQRHDNIPDKNIELSIERAQWAIDHAIPTSWKQYCNPTSAQQSKKCQVYILGDSNDAGHSSDGGLRNSNASARYARVRIIWRQEVCKENTMDSINLTKETLEQIQPTRTDQTEAINLALNIITQLNDICKNTNTRLHASQGENYSNLLSHLGLRLVDLAKTVPEISMLIQQSNFSVMFSTADIDLYYSRIKGLMGNRSVWRNTEGKFNTARLASDSIAGVVLGTVGGIVTSKLVKKNQLKQGFEDLSCNVGGQRVASYGDSFSIGLQ